MIARLLIGAALALAAPAAGIAAGPIADQLSAEQQADYRTVFGDIRAGNWDQAAARLNGMGDGPLHAVARAEIYLAKGSPKADSDALSQLIARAPDLPEALQLAQLLRRRGGDLVLPTLPTARDLTPVKGVPRRLTARSTKSDAFAARLAAQIKPFVKEDRAGEMEGYFLAAQENLTPAARAEFQQRIGWAYYLAGDDENALRLALAAGPAGGDWGTAADWVAGLAAWRLDRCDPAGRAFQSVAANARDDEMRAAGWFWSARADLACRRPEQVQAKLRAAARVPETFYGLVAGRMLGITPAAPVRRTALAAREWTTLQPHSNAQAAVALAEIGEIGLADRMLRWQAQIGPAAEHAALIDLAAQLDLPQTQVWLAHNTPDGVRPEVWARYPSPNWIPANGWRVDRNLVFAHSLEESVFRVGATSGAGARGLMGIMPGTAEQLDRREGLPGSDRARLGEPTVNMAYGQRMLTWLRDLPSTGGLLPKVIAAYNAGPGANIKWNPALRDRGDPFLWIESIPYPETRQYVTLVLRNYWIYQQQAGEQTPGMTAMAQAMWPRFPGLAGQAAQRVSLPARPPVRLALVMPPVRRPAPAVIDDDAAGTMLAEAPPEHAKSAPTAARPLLVRSAAVAATGLTVTPTAVKAATVSASSRALASARQAGATSVTVVKEVARTLAAPMARAQVGTPTGRLDALLGPILAKELPRARAGLGKVTGKALSSAVKDVED